MSLACSDDCELKIDQQNEKFCQLYCCSLLRVYDCRKLAQYEF